ncbi:TIGR04326 family surface carbohydrate biosynthesis protein [Polynucleobacter sp. MWH-UH2A]|uniref:TIGR04326 family surface carbohydrate biosynthesis protein n=1 Tax=Polynucleobacter sp. MWH-UH2A TaxID=1855617 RepID=UPI001BFDF215|nr:TIGR04326 family surface carbohydrate biosynthesis protein [Polynucleobacter sp. MWH-UH2A]QWD64377.1 hypothetical protein IC571_01730 [Polynucleobacter sp. MWH-UH2A]
MVALKVIDDGFSAERSDDESLVVFWCRNSQDQNLSERVICLPNLIEDKADTLRARFLSLIYSIGNREVAGIKLTKYLEIRDKFSFWWMTRLFEKCNWDASQHLFDVIKLMALEEWARDAHYDQIIVYSHNINLIETLKIWAKKEKKSFKLISKSKNAQIKKIKNSLLSPFILVYGTLWLAHYYLRRASLKGVGVSDVASSGALITFISYLFNWPDQGQDKFGSQFWGSLPKLLSKEKIKTNWIHLYVKDKKIPTAKKAAKIINDENMQSGGLANHAALDSFFSIKLFVRILRDWIGLIKKYRRLKKFRFYDEHSSIDFTPFFEVEWRDSIIGRSSLTNLMSFNLLEELVTKLPNQKIGIYLQENCPWELALNYLWRRAGHGKLIGAPHSTILFWDLRYFHDPRLLKIEGRQEIPMPDCIAVNGLAAQQMLIKGGYPQERMVMVEALRYLYLNDQGGRRLGVANDVMKILVLCDYTMSRTVNQLSLLFKALNRLKFSVEIIIKPHPNCPVDMGNSMPKNCQIKNDPVSELLKKCNIAYTTDATSASVEAYLFGIPVISAINPSGFNLSPLRGYSNVVFISDEVELSQAILSKNNIINSEKHIAEVNYFNLESDLPRWRSILNK